MKTSKEGQELMHYFESCELEAYPDPGSDLGKVCAQRGWPMRRYKEITNWQAMSGAPWTIGWGDTGQHVHPGLVWTQEQADERFAQRLGEFERDVESLVTVQLTNNEFDALVSFAYNVGSDIDADEIAEGLGDSTLLKKLNAGDTTGAADEFPKWNRSGGRVLLGLKRRRAAERAHFLGQDWQAAAEAAA